MPENSNNKWTPEEDARLKSLVEASTSIHLIAAKLKGSVYAIRTRASKLNIPIKHVRVGLKAKGKQAMATGSLKMWNADRGFGFIADDSGGPDMFLHISALQSAGIGPDNIRKGDRLTFDVENTREGKNRASNVRQG